jgi:hypothetical protein
VVEVLCTCAAHVFNNPFILKDGMSHACLPSCALARGARLFFLTPKFVKQGRLYLKEAQKRVNYHRDRPPRGSHCGGNSKPASETERADGCLLKPR